MILYELLTGAWPFGDPSSPDQILQRFGRETPMITEEASLARSSSVEALRAGLAGDLTSILQQGFG